MAKKSRATRQVTHQVAEAEENVIWEATEGIFRPVKSDAFKAGEEAAERAGRRAPDDPRAGLPTHRKPDRLTRSQQADVAGELGYTRAPKQPPNAKEPIFYKKGGDPPYISYDRDGHGAVDRGGGGADPNVPWKGGDSPEAILRKDTRSGTYVPQYGPDGSVTFNRVRD